MDNSVFFRKKVFYFRVRFHFTNTMTNFYTQKMKNVELIGIDVVKYTLMHFSRGLRNSRPKFFQTTTKINKCSWFVFQVVSAVCVQSTMNTHTLVC